MSKRRKRKDRRKAERREKLCPYCHKLMRLGHSWTVNGKITGDLKRSREATLLRMCWDPECPGKNEALVEIAGMVW